jgi:hypothetical protein
VSRTPDQLKFIEKQVRTAKMGKQLIYLSPQIANPKILGFIPQLEIRNFFYDKSAIFLGALVC